jgi:hypothetical protein
MSAAGHWHTHVADSLSALYTNLRVPFLHSISHIRAPHAVVFCEVCSHLRLNKVVSWKHSPSELVAQQSFSAWWVLPASLVAKICSECIVGTGKL